LLRDAIEGEEECLDVFVLEGYHDGAAELPSYEVAGAFLLAASLGEIVVADGRARAVGESLEVFAKKLNAAPGLFGAGLKRVEARGILVEKFLG
jgi:hypothetical protein